MIAALTRILRIAQGDIRTIAGRVAYVVAALAPLLLLVMVTLLVVVAAVVLSLVQVADPDVNTMGSGQVALVGMERLGPADAEAVEALIARSTVPTVRPRGALGWAQRLKSYVAQIKGDEGDEAAADAAESSREPIQWVRVEGDGAGIDAQVPAVYDAALVVSPGEGAIQTRIVAVPAILYSRVMERRVQNLVAAANAEGESQAEALTVVDAGDGQLDLWVVHALLVIIAVGAAYTYHGVAVQSVASVLAGERDKRTLEVLLSLPISRRELVWGKLIALVVAIMAPAALWTTAGVLGVERFVGVDARLLRLMLIGALLVLPLTAVGLTISATAPNSQAAQNRLGFANLAVLVFGISAFFLADAVGLSGDVLFAGLLAFVSAAAGGWLWGLAAVGLSLALTAALVEIAARFMRATP